MWKNYLTVAVRNVVKYRRFAVINIGGLAVGLASVILTQVVVDHETSYDSFFPNHERIYAVYMTFQPRVGLRSSDGVYGAVRPLLEDKVAGIETSARAISGEVVARADGRESFLQPVRFVDPEFLDVFTFRTRPGT